jgi:hypothetical protein
MEMDEFRKPDLDEINAEIARYKAAGYRAFQGNYGWYIAQVGADGSHSLHRHQFPCPEFAWHDMARSCWGMEM